MAGQPRSARNCAILSAAVLSIVVLSVCRYSVYAADEDLSLLAVPRWRLMNLLECVDEHERESVVETLCDGCVSKGP